MTTSTERAHEQIALDRHSSLLEFHETRGNRGRIKYYLFQTVMITLCGATPILVLTTSYKTLQALFAAVVGVLASLSGVFHFKEGWIRNLNAAYALRSELVKFQTRSGPHYPAALDDSKALETFVVEVEAIADHAMTEWRALRAADEKKQT